MRTIPLGFLGGAGDIGCALAGAGCAYTQGTDLDALIEQLPQGGAVFALAEAYPTPRLTVAEKSLRRAAEKGIRLLLEYPRAVEGIAFGDPGTTVYERAVVTSDAWAELPRGSILMPCGAYYLPCEAEGDPLMLLARVAGYDRLAFDLPEKTIPLLFSHPRYEGVLIATGSISRVVKARATPTGAYRALWRGLLRWATGQELEIAWTPTAGASYGPDEPLAADARERAMGRSVRWFLDHAMHRVEVTEDMFTERPGGSAPHLDVISRESMLGGVFEGFEAGIDHNGTQRIRSVLRGDCIGETSMVMALDAVQSGSPETRKAALDTADYVLSNVFFQNDPQSPMYGLNNWFKGGPVFYGDDNARVLLGVLLTRSLLDIDRWDGRLLKCTLANLRTAAKTGFRHNALREASFEDRSWTDFAADDSLALYSPHYQCYIWAVYLWMYALTDYAPLLKKARTAIGMCMRTYPDGWRWTNSLTAEMARILLPLAFLVRVEDTPEHRGWLARVAKDVMGCIDETGAVQDMFGDLAMGKYPPPQSNESYGTSEASLIQQNGDPATDLLYTANWAYIGLHEAALLLEDERMTDALERMTDFFCRIQVTSCAHPYLDGAWMRSFDFKKWEYWGSSADIGWGAWCVESGWVNTWIYATMALYTRGESLFNLSAREAFLAIAPEITREMETDHTKGYRAAKAAAPQAMPGSEQ